jgi:tRNA(Ile)-lysidine synthase
MLDRLTIERMAKAAGEGPLLVALSGGGDSVALLLLLAEHFTPARLRAAIIDHKLRDGSADVAREAACVAQAVGVDACVIDLAWPEGGNRAHEAARALRYGALCKHARELGARVLTTGHTRDDQAETVLLRAARGSGLRGLAGMRSVAPAPVWPEGRGLWVARPLLSVRRDALRAELTARGARWIEDPANLDERYARVRARHALERLAYEGFDPVRLAALAEQLRTHVETVDDAAAALIDTAASFEEGLIRVDRARWGGAKEAKQRALYALIAAASGRERGPPPAQLESLAAVFDNPDFSGATLAGAWLKPQRGQIVIRRDPGALAGRAGGSTRVPPLPLPPGEEVVWDGRVTLIGPDGGGWSVALDGADPVLQRDGERRPVAAAAPHWLTKTRVQHVLGRIKDEKSL